MSSLEEIAREECLVLIASLSIGRIAVALPGGRPLVVPVNYELDGEAVVFRTDPGTKLDMLREKPGSFQVDLIDPCHRTGWSVLVQGIAYVTEHAGEHEVELESWVGSDKRHWVRAVPAAITGRRILLPELPETFAATSEALGLLSHPLARRHGHGSSRRTYMARTAQPVRVLDAALAVARWPDRRPRRQRT